MIDEFIREQDYFGNKLLKKDKTIYPGDLDGQFNNIADYLNNILRPAIDELISEIVSGEFGNIGAFLHNVGDGSTDWQKLDDNKLDDYFISLNKLPKFNLGNVLITDDDGSLGVFVADEDNKLIISNNLLELEWRKLTRDDIPNQSLTGKQIGVLGIENFIEDQFVTHIADTSITTFNIDDLAITTDKIKDNTIIPWYFGVFDDLPINPVQSGQLTTNNLNNKIISKDKIANGSIPVPTKQHPYAKLWTTPWGTKKVGNHDYLHLLVSHEIKDQSIEDEHLVSLPNNNGYFNDPSNKYKLSIFGFASKHLKKDLIDIDDFDNEVQTAIRRAING